MLDEALAHLVRGIVEHPDDVDVDSRIDRRRNTEILKVRVHPDDMGPVIGRSGQTAGSLRTVINALAGERVRIDFLDVDER